MKDILYLFSQTVDDLQAISREAKHKIAIQNNTGSASLKPENAQRAMNIIKKYSYEETMKKNAAAAQIHKWVRFYPLVCCTIYVDGLLFYYEN